MRLSEIKKLPSPRKKKRESPKRVKSHSQRKNNKLSEIKKLPSPKRKKKESPKRLMKTPTNTNPGNYVYLNRELKIPVGDGQTISLKIGEKVKIIETLTPTNDQFKSWVNSPDGWAVLVYNDSIAMGEDQINASRRANKVSVAIKDDLNRHPNESEEERAAKLGFRHLKSNGAADNANTNPITSTLASLSGETGAVAVARGQFFYRYKGNEFSATAASNFLTTDKQQIQNIESNIDDFTQLITEHIPANTLDAPAPGAPGAPRAVPVTAVTAIERGLNNTPGLITSLAINENHLSGFVNYIRQFNPGIDELNNITNLVPDNDTAGHISNVIAIAVASEADSLNNIILEALKLNRDNELTNDIGQMIDALIYDIRLTTNVGGGDPVANAAATVNPIAHRGATDLLITDTVATVVADGADLITDGNVTPVVRAVSDVVSTAIRTIAPDPGAPVGVGAAVAAARNGATAYSNLIFDPLAGNFQTFADAVAAAAAAAAGVAAAAPVTADDVIRNVQEIINTIKQIISRRNTDIAAAGAVNTQVRTNGLSNYIIRTLENIPGDFAGIFKQPDDYDTIPYFPPRAGKGDEANPENTTDSYDAALIGAGENKIEGPGNLLLVETEKSHKFAGKNEKKRRFIWWGFNFDDSPQAAKSKKIGNPNQGAKPQGYSTQTAYSEEDSPATTTLTTVSGARGSVGTVKKFFQLGDEVSVTASNKAGKIIEIKGNNPKPYVIDTGQGEKIEDLSGDDLELIRRGDQGYQGVTGRDFLGFGGRGGFEAPGRGAQPGRDVLDSAAFQLLSSGRPDLKALGDALLAARQTFSDPGRVEPTPGPARSDTGVARTAPSFSDAPKTADTNVTGQLPTGFDPIVPNIFGIATLS